MFRMSPRSLLRLDTTARGRVGTLDEKPVTGRLGLGYTLLAGRRLTDSITGPANHVLNANTALRCGSIEIGIDAYNVLGENYADDQEDLRFQLELLAGSATRIAHYALDRGAPENGARQPLGVLLKVSRFARR